jgi:dipeptide/tripeptide permease
VLGIPIFSFISKLAPPLSYGAYAAFGLAAVGALIGIYFHITDRERLAQFAEVEPSLAGEEIQQAAELVPEAPLVS